MELIIQKRPSSGRQVKPRIYIFPRGESVLEHLIERHSRPHKYYRQHVLPEVFKQLALTNVKVKWSQYAGCTCPCSPGFIVTSAHGGPDLYVSVED